jgi:hypothetical protein
MFILLSAILVSYVCGNLFLVFLNKNTIIASVGLCTLLSCASVSLPDQANIRGFNLWLDLKKLLPNADVNLLLKQ